MSGTAVFFVIVGVMSLTEKLFRLIDWIERG